MILVDLVCHYDGEWIREPKLLYERKLVHKWEGYVGVQQLIVSVPSEKYCEIEGDGGIRTLLSFVNDKFDFNQNSEEGTSNTGQVKSKKQKMDEQCDKEKRQTNEKHKTLIDEEDVEYPTPTQDCGGLPLDSSLIAATVEDFPLTAPQPTYDCATEDEDFGLDVEDDMSWKPRDFSELKSRIQQRQNKHNIMDQEESTLIVMMDMRSNKEKKQAKENRTLIDEEDVEDFPLTSPQPTQDCALDKDEDSGLDVEDDMPWKPRDFSELKSIIQQRQKHAQLTGSRRINFF
ncbi:hypothetical protein KY290_037302 [Solanum tuberosum]|uniref:Uncharacterized protein n=1 Tax=Solanum tuberosum TaxID=4113 RepID=A0ABQ7TV41_SOLTU|nr:hypothetical protein KY285_037759 [Solanum tuberosum]KAH0738597.1 hypothetical protein KY290_037302 [Solanum tuberosum]